MPQVLNYEFNTAAYTGKTTVNTGLFIDGKWVDPIQGGIIEYEHSIPTHVLSLTCGSFVGY